MDGGEKTGKTVKENHILLNKISWLMSGISRRYRENRTEEKRKILNTSGKRLKIDTGAVSTKD